MTPRDAGFSQPAEWTPHEATWLAWPSHEDLWGEALFAVQESFVALARAIGDGGAERLEVLVPDGAPAVEARERLSGLPVRLHAIPFGDIWMRDIAPVFLRSAAGEVAAASFLFNGWGGKYDLPGDADASRRVAEASSLPAFFPGWVLEGGSVDVDGEGTLLTTRQCLLNPNRNPGLSQAEIDARLASDLGAETVLWLGDGLLNDHTDGHVDTLVRFVAPATVVAMEPCGPSDPNAESLRAILRDLARMRDARGRKLEVVTVPSPGLVADEEGEPMPASYVNFYIANGAVVVPTYGVPNDERAVAAVAALFPGRRTVAIGARALLGGGGAFHCVTQQQPAGGPRT